MEYYSSIKNVVLLYTTTWMIYKNILLVKESRHKSTFIWEYTITDFMTDFEATVNRGSVVVVGESYKMPEQNPELRNRPMQPWAVWLSWPGVLLQNERPLVQLLARTCAWVADLVPRCPLSFTHQVSLPLFLPLSKSE